MIDYLCSDLTSTEVFRAEFSVSFNAISLGEGINIVGMVILWLAVVEELDCIYFYLSGLTRLILLYYLLTLYFLNELVCLLSLVLGLLSFPVDLIHL